MLGLGKSVTHIAPCRMLRLYVAKDIVLCCTSDVLAKPNLKFPHKCESIARNHTCRFLLIRMPLCIISTRCRDRGGSSHAPRRCISFRRRKTGMGSATSRSTWLTSTMHARSTSACSQIPCGRRFTGGYGDCIG